MSTKARVLHVDTEGLGLAGVAQAAEKTLNAFLDAESLGPKDVLHFACTPVAVTLTEHESGSLRDYHSTERGLLLTVIHAVDRDDE